MNTFTIINEDYFKDIEITDDDIVSQDQIEDTTDRDYYQNTVSFHLSIPLNGYTFQYDKLDVYVSQFIKLAKCVEYYMRNCDAFTEIGQTDIIISPKHTNIKRYSNYDVFYNDNEARPLNTHLKVYCNCLFTQPNDLTTLLRIAFERFHKLVDIGCHFVQIESKTYSKQISFKSGIEYIFNTNNTKKQPSIWKEYTNGVYAMTKYNLSLPGFYGKCLKKYGGNNDTVNYPPDYNYCGYHGFRHKVKHLRELPRFNYIELVIPGAGGDVMAFNSKSGTFGDDIVECENWADTKLPNYKEECHKIIQTYYDEQRDFVMLVNSYQQNALNVIYVLDGTYILDGKEYVIEFANIPQLNKNKYDENVYDNAVSINMMIQTGYYNLDSAMEKYMTDYIPLSYEEAKPVRQKYIECFGKEGES